MRRLGVVMSDALQIECSSRAWWGECWGDSWPFAITTTIQTDTHGLPNAPVSIFVMTTNPLEAVQLLRLAADRLEREPALLVQIGGSHE